ncbi:hypothetical protein BGX27_006149 [Mortierella sp. AM989]|nr:hypothetical protein BGX27_006149 [Mortierella sp. AM989]
MEPIPSFRITGNFNQKFKNKAGESFVLSGDSGTFLNNHYKRIDVRADRGDGSNSPAMISIPLEYKLDHRVIFVPSSSLLVLSANRDIQVWNLSANESRPCKLSHVLRIEEPVPNIMEYYSQKLVSGKACGHSFSLQFKRKFETEQRRKAYGPQVNWLTVPFSAQDPVSIEGNVRWAQGISSLLNLFAEGGKTYKEEVIQYLKSHLRPTLEHPESSLITICKAWTAESKSDIEIIIRGLLPADQVTWILDSSKNSEDPLSIILKFAKTQPSAIYTAKIIMDYCVNHAIRNRNLAFLDIFFRSLNQVMDLVPQEGLLRLGRIYHIPVMNRSYILNNHIIAHPPNWQFWKQNSTPLNKITDPIMQFHITSSNSDRTNDLFTRPIFMASFDALWCYRDDFYPTTAAQSAKEEARTTWWKILYHLIRLKCCLRIHNYVECYDFNLEFYENPAVAALVAYKWFKYNFLDIIAFCLPMAASTNQLVNIYQEDTQGNTHLMSFSVLVVSLHMGGRWDPANELFMTENWAFHIMMAICFFCTVILTMNVLIALINKAFATGDEGWRLSWVESRLRYIESAEELSYHIPGFRQTYNWFPKEIYFSSSRQKAQKFRERYLDTSKAEADLEALEDWVRNGGKVEKGERKGGKKNKDKEASSDDKVEELNVANPISGSKGGDASEVIEKAGKEDTTSSSTTDTTARLNSHVGNLNSQIVDLKSQVGVLSSQAGDLKSQVGGLQKQVQRQHDEIVKLLSTLRQ